MNYNRLRDFFERELILIRSIPLIDELATLCRDPENGAIVPRNKDDADDRAMAMGFAVQAFWDVELYGLQGTPYTYGFFEHERTRTEGRPVTERDLLQGRLEAFIRKLEYRRKVDQFGR
jgi:hypothetical protein